MPTLRLLSVCLIVLACGANAQAQSPRERYDQHVAEGNKLHAAGRPAEALPHFQAAAALLPQIPGGVERSDRLLYSLGLALSAVGRKDESLKTLQEVESWRRKNLPAGDPETVRAASSVPST